VASLVREKPRAQDGVAKAATEGNASVVARIQSDETL
jgi:hypothetical protein